MEREDLVIEIGCEDLPSWTGKYIRERWIPTLENMVRENRIPYTSLSFYNTSRRLILYFRDVSPMQNDFVTEITGPPVSAGIDSEGNYTQAAKGFAASNDTSLQDLFVREKKGKKVLALAKKEKGKPSKDVIGSIIQESLKKTEIPRAMKWKEGDTKFIRPVRWILALLGREVVNIEIGGIRSSRYTFGHRVLSPAKLKISSSREYPDRILKNFVMFDGALRFEYARALIGKEASECASFEESQLKEIMETVEYPFALRCGLKEEYLSLPPEVVSAVILKLRGIPLFDAQGRLKPFYITISDGVKGESVNNNYLSVLSSKMEDAIFFMEKDMSIPFHEYSANLKRISYHPRWGSVHDRVERFKKISKILMEYTGTMGEEVKNNVDAAISLCKNDLSTLMVAEFPSLEGIIGRIYASKSGMSPAVSNAIEQHYFPKSSDSPLPGTIEASILSIVSRIETLCGMFLDGIEVKGGGDPYGVKKTANGLIEIIWHEKMSLPLKELIGRSLIVFIDDPLQTGEKIVSFILQRVENILSGEGLTPGIRRAVIAAESDNLLNIRLKTDALKEFFSAGSGKNVLVPFIRVANILKQAGEKGIRPAESIDESLLEDETERRLYDFLVQKESLVREYYKDGRYILFLEQLGGWRQIIDSFFQDVLVMCDDEKTRKNRLALLLQINEIFGLFADFSMIPIVEVENA